jgi:hypothetical protein
VSLRLIVVWSRAKNVVDACEPTHASLPIACMGAGFIVDLKKWLTRYDSRLAVKGSFNFEIALLQIDERSMET